MHRPPRRKPNPYEKPKEPPPPTSMTRGQQLQIIGLVVVVGAIYGVSIWYHAVKIGRYDLDSNVDYLVATYHLDAEQARGLRALETDFHSRGKRFGFLVPGDGNSEAHHRALSQCMDPDQATRFMAEEAGRVR